MGQEESSFKPSPCPPLKNVEVSVRAVWSRGVRRRYGELYGPGMRPLSFFHPIGIINVLFPIVWELISDIVPVDADTGSQYVEHGVPWGRSLAFLAFPVVCPASDMKDWCTHHWLCRDVSPGMKAHVRPSLECHCFSWPVRLAILFILCCGSIWPKPQDWVRKTSQHRPCFHLTLTWIFSNQNQNWSVEMFQVSRRLTKVLYKIIKTKNTKM